MQNNGCLETRVLDYIQTQLLICFQLHCCCCICAIECHLQAQHLLHLLRIIIQGDVEINVFISSWKFLLFQCCDVEGLGPRYSSFYFTQVSACSEAPLVLPTHICALGICMFTEIRLFSPMTGGLPILKRLSPHHSSWIIFIDLNLLYLLLVTAEGRDGRWCQQTVCEGHRSWHQLATETVLHAVGV